jgi:hypothetical protein
MWGRVVIKRSAPEHGLVSVFLIIGLVCCALLCAPSVFAQQAPGAGTSEVPEGQAASPNAGTLPRKDALADFSWLAGRWVGKWGPRIAQQVWMPPNSGVIAGVFQLSENGRTLVIELFTISSTPQGIELRVRHFTSALTPWETRPSLLNLKSVGPKSILFENADNGQPKSWLMKRTGPDAFVQRFEIVSQQGQQQVAEIAYQREPAPTQARRSSR